MQLYLPGINPLYWKQVSELPEGVYNKTNNQTSTATINQLFVAFVDLPMGTSLDVYMSIDGGNFQFITTANVADNTGFLYARFPIPYSRSMDTVEIILKEHGPNFSIADKTVASEVFSSGHIAYMFEIQDTASQQALIDAVQLEQNLTIEGIDGALLQNKFGVFTELTRRANQTINDYRSQTSCLWKAFQYAATNKGVMDAIRCVIGDFEGAATITLTPTRQVLYNEIFALPQFGATGALPGFFVDNASTSGLRWDEDYPHFYIPDLGVSGTGFFIDGSDIDTPSVLGPYPMQNTGNQWDSDTVQVFTIPSTNALGNEVMANIEIFSVGIPEEYAISIVQSEEILRNGLNIPDTTANAYLVPPLDIKGYMVGGLWKTDVADLPQLNIDYTLDNLSGKINWKDPASGFKVPDTNTTYIITYQFRLDQALKSVVSKIKPAQKIITLEFSERVSGLPRTLEI